MPLTPHVERHFTSGETVRDIVIGMSDGLTVPFALAAGLSGAVAASNIIIMIGAIVQVHGAKGFLMQNGGYEYNWALIGMLLPILILGPGSYSIGRFLPLPKSPRTGQPVVVLE